MADKIDQTQYMIRALDRALQLLLLFIGKDKELSATDISRLINPSLPPSTIHRLLKTLSSRGYIYQNPETKEYSLGLSCLHLGEAYLDQHTITKYASEYLKNLRDRSGETTHLVSLEPDGLIYLEKFQGLHAVGIMSSRIGSQPPMHCTGVGKVVLAFLPEEKISEFIPDNVLKIFTPNTISTKEQLAQELQVIRDSGYAFDHEEHELGVSCIAVPLFDQDGICGAISIAGPTYRIVDGVTKNSYIELVKDTAKTISINIGGEKYIYRIIQQDGKISQLQIGMDQTLRVKE